MKINQAPIVFNEINIHGKFITKGTFPLAVSIIENKAIPIDKLVTHTVLLRDAKKGIDMMASGEGMKVIVKIDD